MSDIPTPGSWVMCVNASDSKNHLEEGKVYKVHYTQFDRGSFVLKLVGVEGFWKSYRFSKVENHENAPNQMGS